MWKGPLYLGAVLVRSCSMSGSLPSYVCFGHFFPAFFRETGSLTGSEPVKIQTACQRFAGLGGRIGKPPGSLRPSLREHS